MTVEKRMMNVLIFGGSVVVWYCELVDLLGDHNTTRTVGYPAYLCSSRWRPFPFPPGIGRNLRYGTAVVSFLFAMFGSESID
jgi:hypothetical protein